MCVASTAIVGARASSGMFSAVLRATGGGGTAEASGSDGGDASSTSSIEEFDANARESATAAAIRKGARVRLTSERARELTSAPMMAVYGGVRRAWRDGWGVGCVSWIVEWGLLGVVSSE